jgi:ABC-type dipeptide/oligopeptide/nickel transport system ATPase subunit
VLEQSHRDPEKEPLVRLLAASKFFGRTRAFGPVDFALESGESAALIGRSGAGKSSLARCLSGLEPLSEGRRLLLPGLESRSIQLVFQDSPVAMNPAWTVQAILAEPLRVAGIPVTLDGLRERLEEVGLTAAN